MLNCLCQRVLLVQACLISFEIRAEVQCNWYLKLCADTQGNETADCCSVVCGSGTRVLCDLQITCNIYVSDVRNYTVSQSVTQQG